MKLEARTTKLTEFSLDEDQIVQLIREALCHRLFGTENAEVPKGTDLDLRLNFDEYTRSSGYVTVKEPLNEDDQ